MPIYIEGLRELRAELRAVEGASTREVTAALRDGAKKVAARSNELAPRGKTGQLASDGRPYSTTREAGVRYGLIYAPVQEFAVDWVRRTRGHGGGKVTAGERRAHRKHGSTPGGATNEVHYSKGGPTPRFAWRAVNELGPGLVAETFERLVSVLRCHGWFRE